MSTATLKKSLGEGGAFIGDSHGEDQLLAVLTALANASGEPLSFKQAIATTGIKASILADVASKLGNLIIKVGTTGSAGQTDIDVNINGVQVGQLVVTNTEANGISKTLKLGDAVAAGDLIEIEFTAVATANADVTATVRLNPVTVEI